MMMIAIKHVQLALWENPTYHHAYVTQVNMK